MDEQPSRREQRVVEIIAAVLAAGLSAAVAAAALRKAFAPLRTLRAPPSAPLVF
ncbi:hypothetical protein [Actinomadura rubrisoli]|uniref:hypothetical protein n=1 Tax=Actinomadura rubrisoli TaxID=2530368 RepID=UPI0014049578|nr:hypothetical protein [Actinomadura rubrisoli]